MCVCGCLVIAAPCNRRTFHTAHERHEPFPDQGSGKTLSFPLSDKTRAVRMRLVLTGRSELHFFTFAGGGGRRHERLPRHRIAGLRAELHRLGRYVLYALSFSFSRADIQRTDAAPNPILGAITLLRAPREWPPVYKLFGICALVFGISWVLR